MGNIKNSIEEAYATIREDIDFLNNIKLTKNISNMEILKRKIPDFSLLLLKKKKKIKALN